MLGADKIASPVSNLSSMSNCQWDRESESAIILLSKSDFMLWTIFMLVFLRTSSVIEEETEILHKEPHHIS